MIHYPLPYYGDRPVGAVIDTVVVHSMYSSVSDKIEDCIALLEQNTVASHYGIARNGDIWALVPEEKRAWHAGVSAMPFEDDSRSNVNDFSIGIELVTIPEDGFLEPQYEALIDLLRSICSRNPIRNIVGHDAIAPSRKVDPGPAFQWARLQNHPALTSLRFGIRSW